MNIYVSDDSYKDVSVSDNSFRYRQIGKTSVTLYFTQKDYLLFPAGSWIEYEGKKYQMLSEGSFKKNSNDEYEYTLIFEDHSGKLRLWTLKNYATDEFKFSMTMTPREAAEWIVENLNERDSEKGWSVGECIESDHKVFDFNNTKLDAALAMIASEFNTESDFVGKKLNLKKVEYNKETPLPLSYGKGRGFLPGVGVVSTGTQSQFEILLVQGGQESLDSSRYQNEHRWHLPRLAELEYKGITYVTDEKGRQVTIKNKPLTTKTDITLDLTSMAPLRVGTVTESIEVDPEKHFVDIIDATIPDDPKELDYSACRIGGETATITFQSGMLAGRTFDIQQTEDKLTGYIHAEKRFKLVPKTEDGMPMPAGVYMPEPDDKYLVFGIMLPDAYVTGKEGLEWEMFRAACRYFDEQKTIPFSFSGEIDGKWAKQDWLNRGGMLEPGWHIRFSDPYFKPDGYDVRVVGLRDYVNDPYTLKVELSNEMVSSSIATDFAKMEGQAQRMDREKQSQTDYQKRSFADAIRTAEMLVNAGLEGFTDRISPISIQAMQLLVGAKECQFQFVNGVGGEVITKTQTYNKETKEFKCEAGYLKHNTIGIDYIGSSHQANEYYYWDIPAFKSPTLAQKEQAYYVYARCPKSQVRGVQLSGGIFELSNVSIPLENETGYWHFLLGILNPEYDGDRSYAPMYGFSLIEPGRIVADRMQSSNFNEAAHQGSLIDLSNNRIVMGRDAEIIAPKIRFKSGGGDDVDFGADEYAQIGADISDAKEAAISEAQNALLASQWSSGEFLFKNVAFEKETLPTIYFPGGLGTGTMSRIRSVDDNPINNPSRTNWIMRIVTTTPLYYPEYRAGFTFSNMSRPNAIFVCRIIAKIPEGYDITWASNATGDGRIDTWATPTKGTGNWAEYIHILRCGAVGVFSDTSYFHLIVKVANRPLSDSTWDVAYACCSDITNVKNANTIANEVKDRNIAAVNDDIITIEEKVQLRRDWIEINGDGTINGNGTYWKLKKVAETYKIDATILDTAFVGISTAFGSAWVNIVSDTDYVFTTTAGISKKDYIAKFSAWETAVQDMSNKISQKGIDNIEVGGVNLFSMLKYWWCVNFLFFIITN